MAAAWLADALQRIRAARVAVFGDFCLDAYWLIDPDESEVSVETGLPVRRVRAQRYSLGGASNVAGNLAALGVAQVRAVGLVGPDVFGRLLRDMLAARGVDTSGLLDGQEDWQTMVFGKPCVGDVEHNRIDFGGFNAVRPDTLEALARELGRAAEESTAVVLNQQVPAGVSPPAVVERLNRVIAEHPQRCFVVDSRDRAEIYRGAALKVNAHEAARICGEPRALGERVPEQTARRCAAEIRRRTGRPVFVTRGAQGILVADEQGLFQGPAVPITGPIDPVGAGDTAVAAIAAVLGSGGDPRTAARVANIAAAVTVRKLRTTGTATPEEILALRRG